MNRCWILCKTPAACRRGGLQTWRRVGGIETLHSYGVALRAVMRGLGFAAARADLLARLPAAHLAFLQRTGLSFSIGDYFFCHAGVRDGVPLDQQAAQDLLWIRDEFLTQPPRVANSGSLKPDGSGRASPRNLGGPRANNAGRRPLALVIRPEARNDAQRS